MYRWSLLVGAKENNAGNTRAKIDATPNPAHRAAVIHYTVEKSGPVIISVCDIQGREIVQLVNENKPAGTYSTGWKGKDARGCGLPTGVYFCRLATNGEISLKKIVWLR
jgi:flagellar hook assembly protein FlgD